MTTTTFFLRTNKNLICLIHIICINFVQEVIWWLKITGLYGLMEGGVH